MMRKRGLMILVPAVLCLLYVWMQIDLLRVGYDIERLEKRKAILESQHEALRFQWSQLTSPQRIAKEATNKLGLQIPKSGQIVMVSFEGEVPGRVRTPEQPLQLVRWELGRQ
ncbi:MAG: cell division protein FtsL [Nitrospirales bacterium]|nr:cell division protein FtsL [Nitrospirales bacterium]